MATKKTLSDTFLSTLTPPKSALSPLPVGNANSTAPSFVSSAPSVPLKTLSPTPAAAPAAYTPPPTVPGTVTTPPSSLFSPSSSGPTGQSGPTGATGAAVPSQWLKADGTFYSPEEVAASIASKLASSNGTTGDVGTIAGSQFSAAPKTAVQLAADASNINNTRNDIAVGATDPYKVASKSGVAYTPEELSAIEKAYSGVYDPALDTAMAKLQKQQQDDSDAANNKADEDKIRLQAQLDNDKPYTLGKDDIRYDSNGNIIAQGASSTTGTSGTYTPGADPTADAYVAGIKAGTYKASDIPDEYKGIVAQGLQQSTQNATSPTTSATISVVDQLLSSPVLSKISGIPGISSFFPGTQAQTAENLASQLKGMLSLANRSQLKGSGAISDFEFKVLGDASSALGIGDNGKSNLSDSEFVNQLNNLKLKLQVGPTSLTDDEVQFLNSQGYTPDQIKAYSNSGGFSSVGNTTASTTKNRPQRNNNPGDVKGGGVADALAVGKDDQGHLVFKNAIDGFKALTADLTAKVNGSSKYLPSNPTITELGAVYAEDPNWPKKVAAILGVSPDTKTKSIPIIQLAQAVAKQEGFYA